MKRAQQFLVKVVKLKIFACDGKNVLRYTRIKCR